MKMKRYIAAGILATALLASGCGKFVRDELITMQNEIDQLTKKVSQMMNQDLAALSEVVTQMENGGYVTSADSFTDEEGRGGIVLTFNNGKTLSLYHGADGNDGADAVGPAIFPQWDEEAGHYYWAVKNEGVEEFSWLLADGDRVQAGAVDGKTPKVKIEEGYWWLSPDGSEEGFVKQEWPVSVHGEDADQIFSLDYEVFDDRSVLVLAQTGDTLVTYSMDTFPRLEVCYDPASGKKIAQESVEVLLYQRLDFFFEFEILFLNAFQFSFVIFKIL